jgi:hypothetical protein
LRDSITLGRRPGSTTIPSEGIAISGEQEAWLANIAPIPEPSSVALAGRSLAAKQAGSSWPRDT